MTNCLIKADCQALDAEKRRELQRGLVHDAYMAGDKQAECHNRAPFYGLRLIIFSRLSALVSPKNSYLCSVRGTFFLLKTDKYSDFTSVIL